MKRFNTLRLRLAGWVAALVFLVTVILGAFVYFNLASSLFVTLDDSLRANASQALSALSDENGNMQFEDTLPQDPNIAAEIRTRGVTLRALGLDGKILDAFGPYRTMPASSASLDAARTLDTLFETIQSGEASVRVFTLPIVENGNARGMIQAAQNMKPIQQTLSELLLALIVGGGILLVVSAVGGYVIATRALSPIDRITQTAESIARRPENLAARLNLLATNDEVGRLAATFDRMLARLEDSFRRERQFTADASHELRTPLAAMQAILAVTRARPRRPDEYEQALADIGDEAERMRALVEGLLQLAREDTQNQSAREPLNLSDLLTDVTDALRPLALEKGLTLTSIAETDLSIEGDRDALIRLFTNLLDNAIKYTEHGQIAFQAKSEANGVRILISDTGMGIAPKHLPYLFDRFYRADAARATHGTGLGLAIASDIVRAHGGTIEVSSQEGSGTQIIVQLPAAPFRSKTTRPL